MKSLVVFSHLRWNFVYQRPQHLLSRLAKEFNIFFVEEPIFTEGEAHLKIDWQDGVCVIVPYTNVEGWGFNAKQLIVIGEMLQTMFTYEPREWAENYVYPPAIEILLPLEDYGIWFYTPQALPLLGFFTPELVIFDVMDELKNFVGAPPELLELEQALLERADIVIAGGPSLWRAKAAIRPDTINLPSAVDGSHYSPANAALLESSKHVEDKLEHDIPHPRLGFFGVIDERLDIELVEKLADENLNWHIIMVGPVVKIDPASLPQRSNIHWVGSQQYEDLPMIVQGWDVCLLPFALNDSTKFISPTKTLEYMAAEKPIVSSAIHDVVELYGSVVRIGHTHEGFISACIDALVETDLEKRERLERSAAMVVNQSWDKAATTVLEAIQRHLPVEVAAPV